jgi:hypothetical protein
MKVQRHIPASCEARLKGCEKCPYRRTRSAAETTARIHHYARCSSGALAGATLEEGSAQGYLSLAVRVDLALQGHGWRSDG